LRERETMSEYSDVQKPMLDYAGDIGWETVITEKALQLRGGDGGVFFYDVLEEQLIRLNPGILDLDGAGRIIRDLGLIKPTIEGNLEALRWMKGEHSVFVQEEKRELNVRLIDFDHPENNVFQVTSEWVQRNLKASNRADVVFLINGIPVAVVETKYAGKPEGLSEGVDQIRRYHRETPEMFVATQVFDVTQLKDLFYGVTWNTSRKNIFNWKDEVQGDYERKVKAFFDRKRFLSVLKEHIVFQTVNDELVKIILRQHQTRAVEKVVERVRDKSRQRGLIWHTQGSGKTLTMITIAAKLLREVKDTEKPTVVMIVDRNELEGQLSRNIEAYGIRNYKLARSKADLRSILASDYRGLVVSMIHKFDEIPAGINQRESVIVLTDEAHRTTGGDLGNYLMAALPNATYIGFTGTPIDRLHRGEGTFKVFGVDDEKGYLDKYSIAESIEDGTTVKLNYAHGPSELLVDEEILEKEFWGLAQSEGVSDIEELNAILDRAVKLKEAMKAAGRMDEIAQHVARHYRETVEPMGFKAFLVAVDREACALYKKALDKYLPPEYSRVVYSSGPSDTELLKEFQITPEEEKLVRRNFTRKAELPKILIVTEKLLTGFDAPILYCMYLDKPMRSHVLLQTIARVNRPYEDDEGLAKPYGLIIDFVGIFDNLKKALSFDSDVVGSVIQNIDVLKNLFAAMMKETGPKYLPLTQGWGDKAKEKAADFFEDKDAREEFYRFFRQLQNLYDILSPDAFLGPYIKDFQAIAELYGFIRSWYSNRPYVDKELTEKTKMLLRQHTDGMNFGLPGTIHELGAEELLALKRGNLSAVTKTLNLRKLLSTVVSDEGHSRPFLLSIGERAKDVEKKYDDRQITTQQALADFEKLAQECVESDAERDGLGMDNNTFAVYTVLRSKDGNAAPDLAKTIDSLFVKYPDYQWNEQQKRRLRMELYKELQPVFGRERFVDVADGLLRLQRVYDRNGN
jgi:type I restriction enzyme R subunit